MEIYKLILEKASEEDERNAFVVGGVELYKYSAREAAGFKLGEKQINGSLKLAEQTILINPEVERALSAGKRLEISVTVGP